MSTAKIGIISDTHGFVRPAVHKALSGVDRIIHAGDVGKPEVLKELSRIAPVSAVRGNADRGVWAEFLPTTEVIEVSHGLFVYVLHNIGMLDLDPKAAGFAAVIYGHSHKPAISEKSGVLYLNPGSAGPRRFTLPVTLMSLDVSGRKLLPRLIPLDV